jgi:hypothetical protein
MIKKNILTLSLNEMMVIDKILDSLEDLSTKEKRVQLKLKEIVLIRQEAAFKNLSKK